ncbi:hypothetical protein NHX12_025291 [Muraenolepis orangiensis]|uniref:ERCC4 domain-containing protein n=1 Tax=Muraenolepis orangiensis TaxID=630683 RepID=A0A9Q0EHZ3_9TELE|nr:hypothetical protein NHX12_025291 [Muraenolepis orangiensis]
MSSLRLHRAPTWEVSDSEDEGVNGNAKTESMHICVEGVDSRSSSDNTSPTPASSTTPASTDRPSPQVHCLSPPREPTSTPLSPNRGPWSTTSPSRTAQASSISPGRKRRSREQREADKLKAKQKRGTREELRAAKAQEKEEKKREQQKRKELTEHHEGSDVLLDNLSASGWRFVINSQQLPQAICWTRELTQPGEDGLGFVEEEQVSWILDLADFIDVVISVKEILQGNEDASRQSLLKDLLEFLNRNLNKAVTMLVIGSPINSATAWDVPRLQTQIGMEDLDMEEVMVYLQVSRNISLSFFRDWQDVTQHLVAVTKALSKRPSRHLTEQAVLPFCLDGSWASGCRVSKDGSGLRQVWDRQVQQLNRVSVAVATAVTAAYPSPRLLLQAYWSLESTEQRRSLLAHLSVAAEGKDRRVGRDVSSRMYRGLSEDNPEMVLD